MRVSEFIVLVMLFGALGIGLYALWINLPGEAVSYKPFSAGTQTPEGLGNMSVSGEIVQFYPNMRYRDRNISYRLESTCTQKKWENIQKAFNVISERTALSFYSSRESPEIRVLCSEVSPASEEKGHFIAGEGGPSEVINTSKFAVIFTGKIALYRDERCDEPKIAIHEIFHALGFDHYNNSRSILYPVTGCDQEIDAEIISDINSLYSFDSLPDLMIESIYANKTGRFLNFDINITNVGLMDSKGAELKVYVNDNKVANFSVGALEIGMKKLLFVQNIRVPSDSENIVFSVDSADDEEITMKNNRAEITLG